MNEDVIGENGLLLVVVAVEDKNSLAIATKHLTRPVLSTGKNYSYSLLVKLSICIILLSEVYLVLV